MPEALTSNQVVAYNLARIRKALGLSQEQAADRLAPYLGERWSKAVYSAAERSFHGKRIRQFTADDLTAFALAFGVPLTYFLIPPRPEDRPAGAVLVSGSTEVPWRDLIYAASGLQYGPAMLMRLRELPKDEQPERVPGASVYERYGSVPGAEGQGDR
jgi:transcriptional regulator with XRE-family HTH domain